MMGEYAEMVLDGDCCCDCGSFISDGDGYTRRCYNCEKDHTKSTVRPEKLVKQAKQKQKMKRYPCKICGKHFAVMSQHLYHAHKENSPNSVPQKQTAPHG